MPQFRGWPTADGAVFGKSADIDSLVLALTGFRRERDRMDIVLLLSTGKSNNGGEMRRGVSARLSYCWTWAVLD